MLGTEMFLRERCFGAGTARHDSDMAATRRGHDSERARLRADTTQSGHDSERHDSERHDSERHDSEQHDSARAWCGADTTPRHRADTILGGHGAARTQLREGTPSAEIGHRASGKGQRGGMLGVPSAANRGVDRVPIS